MFPDASKDNLECSQSGWTVSRWSGQVPGGLESFQVVLKVFR